MAHLDSLIVYDPEPRTREALAFGFSREGYKVYATSDAADALSMAQSRVPQLVVCAVDAEHGLDVVGRLREETATRELPIVVVGERSAREAALRAGADEFVAKPAFIRDVLTLSQLTVAIRQDGDESGVTGQLSDYELYFLARALSTAQRTGMVEVQRGERRGEVHFVKGEVVHARCGRMTGLAAFHQLLLWQEAELNLRMTSPSGERKINMPIDQLLAEGGRFAQEFEAMAARVGGTRAVFRQEPRKAAEVRGQIPAEVMSLLRFYDGQRALIDLVEDSPFKALDTIKITFRLSELGVIVRTDDNREESPLTAQLAVRDWLLGSIQTEARSTVTEAGRRAAEAYAEEQSRRARETSPVDDLLDDTKRVRTLAAGGVAAAPAPAVEVDTIKVGKVELQPSQPPAPPVADFDRTIPFSKMPLERNEFAGEIEARPAAPGPTPTPVPQTVAVPVAQAPAPAITKPVSANLTMKQPVVTTPASPSKPANGGARKNGPAAKKTPKAAPVREPAFTADEESFFRDGHELHTRAPQVETFDDLEPVNKTAPKRRWFSFGGKFSSSQTKQPPKKR